ncbi:ABC transporter permease [Chitinophaga barathri]|uniref:ABC transporter permease n=1 Tax=Chitinophaga barathri TaxID=1647451 RepID=UPI0019D4C463|nr:ABC transporter permease [Chitinophaga barathri]
MLKNYFKTAWRSLTRNKVYTLINVTGLTAGVACCILIALYVKGELSYDGYHEHKNEIYRVLQAYRQPAPEGKPLPPPKPAEYQVWGNAPVGPALMQEFPQIKKLAQFTSPLTLLLQHQGYRFQENNIPFADSILLQIFSWKMLYGNRETALEAPFSIVLTQSTARKYFGDTNPVGQELKVENKFTFNVTGVIEDVPENSHFNFNGLMSMSTFRGFGGPEVFSNWGYVDFYTYFLVDKGTDIAAMQARTASFVKRKAPNEPGYSIMFEPMADAYLHSGAMRQPGVTGSLSNVYIFSVIGIFILLIACINFMNLSTARSMERAKEVGVRKAIGANQKGLVFQFLTESVLISVVAVLAGITLAVLFLPVVRNVSGKAMGLSMLFTPGMTAALFLLPLLLGMLAGSYPAWALARFKPVEVLRGRFKPSGRGIVLRKGLVIAQFSLSVALIAGTAIVYSQLKHMRSRDLGFNQDQVLVIDFGGDEVMQTKIKSTKAALKENPAVISVTASRAVPGDFFPNAGTQIESKEGAMKSFSPSLYEVDVDFIPAYNIKMAAGRAYSRDYASDPEEAMVINEAAARELGYANPEEVIGKKFDQWGRKGKVVGVVTDFNYESLHKKVVPLAMRLAPRESLNKLSVHIKSNNVRRTVSEIEKIWGTLAPHRPFIYNFLDQSFNMQY